MPLLELLISPITPHSCLNCQAEGSLLCEVCRGLVCLPAPAYCFRCHQPAEDNALCADCRQRSPLQHVWVGTEYSNRAKELVHKLKFHRAQAAVGTMAALLAERLPYLDEDLVIAPVPTATHRVRQRGYDQALLLARQLARIKRVRLRRLIKRLGQGRQVGANRQQRLQQLQSAFYVPTKVSVPARVLLVDDILTTGATLESAARALKEAGVKHIDAVVFAQKV